MKKQIGLDIPAAVASLLTIACVLVAFTTFVATPAAAQSTQVTLLHISDTHSHLDAWGAKDTGLNGTLGGLPKVAAIVAAERALDPNAIFVHAGDFMDGDLFFSEYLGAAELQLLQSIGLDALVLGNHDFRLGPDFLTGVLQTAWPGGGVPILGANLDTNDHPLGSWINFTIMREVDGVKVGFFGLSPRNGALANPQPVVINKYPDPATKAVAELRAAGAQVVVCVAHIGMIASLDLAQKVPGIDIIVNGHDNAVLKEPATVVTPAGKTFIVSAGNHYRWVGRLRITVDNGKVSLFDYALLSADGATTASPAMQAKVDELKSGIVKRCGDVYHQPLAWAEQELGSTWKTNNADRDTPLGNLFTDAYRAWTGTDVAIEPIGFLGDPLPQGIIVGADVFRAMSYGSPAVVDGNQIVRPWRLVTFRATGDEMMNALDLTLAFGGDFFPQVSGLRMDYDSSATEAKILRNTAHVNGHQFMPDQLYSVTVTEGVYYALISLGLTVQDVKKLPTTAFDAARCFVALQGQLGRATSNRLHDIAAIPGQGR